jgi:hypothetical protein
MSGGVRRRRTQSGSVERFTPELAAGHTPWMTVPVRDTRFNNWPRFPTGGRRLAASHRVGPSLVAGSAKDRADRDRRFNAVDHRFDVLDANMSRQFVWLVGVRVMTLVALVTALGAMLAALIRSPSDIPGALR